MPPKRTPAKPPAQPDSDRSMDEHPGYRNLGKFSEAYRDAQKLEGDPVPVKELVGREFVVERYFRRHSKFEKKPGAVGADEYAAVQIELEGAKRYFNTSSAPLMDQLERTKLKMPYLAGIEEKESAAGRTYLSLK